MRIAEIWESVAARGNVLSQLEMGMSEGKLV